MNRSYCLDVFTVWTCLSHSLTLQDGNVATMRVSDTTERERGRTHFPSLVTFIAVLESHRITPPLEVAIHSPDENFESFWIQHDFGLFWDRIFIFDHIFNSLSLFSSIWHILLSMIFLDTFLCLASLRQNHFPSSFIWLNHEFLGFFFLRLNFGSQLTRECSKNDEATHQNDTFINFLITIPSRIWKRHLIQKFPSWKYC